MKLSILIPALNEAGNLAVLLPRLQAARQNGHEVILCDGGSTDRTVAVATALVDKLIIAPRGRSTQMNEAARHATGDLFLFLHADTLPPKNFYETVISAIEASARSWGRFDVRIDSERKVLRIVGFLMNWRSRWTGIVTGDQALFVSRELFWSVGGFPEIALMEDIAISRLLKAKGPALCLRQMVTTSARRWERHGIIKTILTMWCLRLAYWMGADPTRLAGVYYGQHH